MVPKSINGCPRKGVTMVTPDQVERGIVEPQFGADLVLLSSGVFFKVNSDNDVIVQGCFLTGIPFMAPNYNSR